MIGGSVFVDVVAPREAAVLADLHAEGFSRTWNAHDFATLLADPTVFALAVRRRGLIGGAQAAGFVLVRFAADEAEILTIAVGKRHRRRGYARMLMEDVIRRLYREQIASLFLEVDRANIAAVNLYTALGFTTVGERKTYYSNPTDGDGTALVMRLQVR
jgi:[ribosomal protein S18]-alanine N-acetyltransferase